MLYFADFIRLTSQNGNGPLVVQRVTQLRICSAANAQVDTACIQSVRSTKEGGPTIFGKVETDSYTVNSIKRSSISGCDKFNLALFDNVLSKLQGEHYSTT